jgi:hypothetical protein
MFALFNFFRKKEETQTFGGPYRTPAKMPAPIHDSPPPKPKRHFKMPNIKPTKSLKIFLLLIPACLCIVGMGMAHDASFIGEGIKWGSGAACLLMGAFFVIKAIYTALDG